MNDVPPTYATCAVGSLGGVVVDVTSRDLFPSGAGPYRRLEERGRDESAVPCNPPRRNCGSTSTPTAPRASPRSVSAREVPRPLKSSEQELARSSTGLPPVCASPRLAYENLAYRAGCRCLPPGRRVNLNVRGSPSWRARLQAAHGSRWNRFAVTGTELPTLEPAEIAEVASGRITWIIVGGRTFP